MRVDSTASVRRLVGVEVPKLCDVAGLVEYLWRCEIPPDARIDDLFLDQWTKRVVFMFEHAKFEVVPEGSAVPVRHPERS